MIHRYQLNGYNIVLDVFSGSVHIVDDLAYDIIGMYEDADKDAIIAEMLKKYASDSDVTEAEIRDCIDDVEELKNEGRLFTQDTQLRVLLCKPGQISRRPRTDEL